MRSETLNDSSTVYVHWVEDYVLRRPGLSLLIDGGTWGRPTWWGDADNLEAALEIAKTGRRGRQQGGHLS